MLTDASILFVAAFLAGALNAVAGGGSFLTLPALVFAGVPPLAANATGTLALLPGYLSGAWALRDDMEKLRGFSLPILSIASLIGGTLGALLLLWTPAPVFDIVIPWLLLAATLLFALAPGFITAQSTSRASKRLVIAVVLAVAIYGGYFNGGLGILLLAAFGALGVGNINAANGLKNLVSALLTAIAVLVYIAGGLIYWPEAVWMMVGATSGGYAGARASRRVPVKYLRWCIVAAGAVMSLVFFVRV